MAAAYPAVEALVNDVTSEDKAVLARCQVALQLARALDEAVEADTGAAQMAVSSLSKELRSAIDDVASVEGKKQAFHAGIFDSD